MRIATGCIGHETNTFSSVPTSIDDFKRSYHIGDGIISAFKQTSTITGGFIESSEKLGIQIVPLLWTFATPSGAVEQGAYDTLKGEFLDLLRNAGQIDGVLLDLHGAMATEEIEDAEGDLIRSVREIVGSLPIVVTLDLHANITAGMAEYSDTIIGFDTYPHVDCYDRGVEAAQVISDIVRGNIHPTMAYRQLPLLTSPPAQCTMKPLMSGVVEHLHALETEPGGIWDFPRYNASVLVDRNSLNDMQTSLRSTSGTCEAFTPNLVSVEEAIEIANRADGQPIVLAEGSDNPGGGGPCDGTIILRKFIEADVQDAVIAIIADPESVGLAIQAGVGNTVVLNVGGKTIPMHGDPVALTGYVKTISDGQFVYKGPMGRGVRSSLGRTAVVKVGGVEIILTERRVQPIDAEVLRSVGIEPRDRKLIALKSAVHFRADYTPIAHEILEVDTPGVHSPDLFSYDYQKVRRPIYPLDTDVEFRQT